MKIKSDTSELEAVAFDRWVWWHDGNNELIAKLSGVSLRTVQRWRKAGAMPKSKALLVDQVMHGKGLQFAAWRGSGCLATRWREKEVVR